MISRGGSVPEPERYVCPRIGRFRPSLLVSFRFIDPSIKAEDRITQRDTFDEIARLRETILRIKQPPLGVSVPMVIVGSKTPIIWREGADEIDKADLEDEREVGSGEGEKMAAMWGCNYHETSAVSPLPQNMVKPGLTGRGSTRRYWGCLRISFGSFGRRLSGGGKISRRRRVASALYYDPTSLYKRGLAKTRTGNNRIYSTGLDPRILPHRLEQRL